MKKKKLTGQQIKFIINMLGLVVFVYSYLYIYNGFVDKKDAAYDEINRVKQEIEVTKKKIAEKDTVIQNTEDIKAQVQAILDSYPVNISKVDNFMFLEQMEEELNMKFSSINPTDSTAFYDTGIPMRNADGTEVEQSQTDSKNNDTTQADTSSQQTSDTASTDKQSDALSEVENEISNDVKASGTSNPANAPSEVTTMTGMESAITMNFETDYQGFKKLVDYIKDYPVQMIIDSISVSRDNTTNKLTGSLVLKRFALAGTGKVYEEPKIDDISIGTDNIFGTDTSDIDIPVVTEETDTGLPVVTEETDTGMRQEGTTEVTP